MYQQEAERQEREEYFDKCVKAAVEKEVKRIINSATCFDCDNPLTVLETEDGIAVKECSKCHGVKAAPETEDLGKYLFNTLRAMNNNMAKQMNGRGM